MQKSVFFYYERYFKSFASLIRSLQKINKWASNRKNFILRNLLFDIITIPSDSFFLFEARSANVTAESYRTNWNLESDNGQKGE